VEVGKNSRKTGGWGKGPKKRGDKMKKCQWKGTTLGGGKCLTTGKDDLQGRKAQEGKGIASMIVGKNCFRRKLKVSKGKGGASPRRQTAQQGAWLTGVGGEDKRGPRFERQPTQHQGERFS